MAYEDQIYKNPDTGKLYSIVNGTAREFIDQAAAQQLAPNAQALGWGVNTAGYSERFGGGTTGGAWSTQQFTAQLAAAQQNQAANQAADLAAAKSNAQVAQTVPVAPTDFQKYFQGELAKGRTAGDILSNNPFMAGGAQGPAAPTTPTSTVQVAAAPAQNQPTMNTAQFTAEFQTKNGRPPTQAELQAFVQNRAAGVPQVSQPQAPTAPKSTYTGSSIVDYLNSIGQASDAASRAKLAAQNGITGYTGTAAQNTALLNKLRGTQGSTQNNTITPEKMQNVDKITVPNPITGEEQVDADAATASANQTKSDLQKLVDQFTVPLTENEKFAQTIRNKQAEIVGLSANRGQEQLDAEKQAGLDKMKADVTDVISQINAKQAEFETYKLQQAGKPMTMDRFTGSLVKKQNEIASDILLLQAKGQALQNNLTNAQATIDRAIDLKYQTLDNQYKIYASQLEALQPLLDKEEKVQAQAQQFLLQQKQQELQDQKDKEKSVQAIVLEAAKNGAPSSVLTQMSKATDFMSAINLGGTYLRTPEQNKFSLQKIGTDENGSDVYGTVNTSTGTVTPVTGGTTDLSSGIVGGYNIKSYATDPNHENAVANILSRVGTISSAQDATNYIKSVAPNSPITGDMVMATSTKYGVDPAMVISMMQQDSTLGTAGKGARTFNPGNVGNDDSGNIRNYGNWQSGVDAVGQWLANHKATQDGADVQGIKSALSVLTPRLTAEQKKSALSSVNTFLKNGDVDSARQAIISTAISALPVEQQNKAFGRDMAIDSLLSIQGLLNEYVKKNGDTGLLSGKAEELAQRIGRTNNPELANLGNQLQLSIVAYRNAVSGAAFTESERQQYDQIFPSIGNVPELNNVKVNSILDAFRGNQKSVLKTVLGEKTFNGLFPKAEAPLNQQQQNQETPQLTNYLDSVLKPQNTTGAQNTQTSQPSGQWTGVWSGVTNWVKSLFK